MRHVLSIFALLLLLSTSSAELFFDWEFQVLQQSNPSVLDISAISIGECAILSSEEVAKIVNGVLADNRIEPFGSNGITSDGGLFLTVHLSCISGESMYDLDVNFGDWWRGIPVSYPKEYGHLGIGEKNEIGKAIKSAVEDAISDYVEANASLRNRE